MEMRPWPSAISGTTAKQRPLRSKYGELTFAKKSGALFFSVLPQIRKPADVAAAAELTSLAVQVAVFSWGNGWIIHAASAMKPAKKRIAASVDRRLWLILRQEWDWNGFDCCVELITLPDSKVSNLHASRRLRCSGKGTRCAQ